MFGWTATEMRVRLGLAEGAPQRLRATDTNRTACRRAKGRKRCAAARTALAQSEAFNRQKHANTGGAPLNPSAIQDQGKSQKEVLFQTKRQ
jgi:hypothetical protein